MAASVAATRRGEHGRSARDRDDAAACRGRQSNQTVTGVGDQRRAGIRNQRDRLAFQKRSEQAQACLKGIVLVFGGHPPPHAVARRGGAGGAGGRAGGRGGGGGGGRGPRGD